MQERMMDVSRFPFWLGVSGGVIGILVLIWAYVPLLSEPWMPSDALTIISAFYVFFLIFPVVGMICGMTGRTRKAGIVMMCCGGIELFLDLFSVGIVAGVFFLEGGFIIYRTAKPDHLP